MQPPPNSPRPWHYALSVLLPIVLVFATISVSVLGFVLWSTTNIDRQALERQNLMVSKVIAAQRSQIVTDLESVAIWDDAVIATEEPIDREWIDINLGTWVHEYFGHSANMVLTADGRPIYLMDHGRALDVGQFNRFASVVLPMVERMRATTVEPSEPGTSVVPQSLSDFTLVQGKPAIVSAMTIVSDSGALTQSRGSERVMIGIKLLDEQVAARLNEDYMIGDGHFSITRSAGQQYGVYPVVNSAGRFITFFEWHQDLPGSLLLRQTGPVLAAAFVVAALVVVLLLRKLQRSSSALEEGRRTAEYAAAHDSLTGLPNRSSFDAHLARILREPSTTPHLWMLMLDLDRFKQVNDTLGHQAGDELIRSVADRLRDLVPAEAFIARLGGDEFGIIASRGHAAIDPVKLSNRIIQSLGWPYTLGVFKAHVGVSIGIVTVEQANAEARELLRKADIALYEAKAGGRNRAVVYREQMNELLQMQHTIEGELREALARNDQLSVAFQPLVDQQSRKVIGAEALARWHHPQYGHISPARFIPAAENTGMIEVLGEFVLRRACELGAEAPGRTIAVNVSPTQLRNPLFSRQVLDILQQTGMRPRDLELEITETILLDDDHVPSENLRTFRTAGIQVALDDFGTGYSSLSYLKRYAVDRIKIDRTFVNQLEEGHDSVAITQAIVTLAHAMDIEVTAEGVEHEKQATILGRLGCNTLQGFLFSAAVSRERIGEIFSDAANARERRRRVKAA